MPQIGSDANPVTFRNHVYKKSDSKGANPRPGFYTQEYKDNWERIFGGKKCQERKQRKERLRKSLQ